MKRVFLALAATIVVASAVTACATSSDADSALDLAEGRDGGGKPSKPKKDAGSGTDDDTLTESDTFTLGGRVNGLQGDGLVLQNGADTIAVAASATDFLFGKPLAKGDDYDVTVKEQPTGVIQSCVVSNGSGTVAASNIGDVKVDCTTESFPISVNVVGLQGSGLTLQNNGAGDVTVPASTSGNAIILTFPNKVPSGQPFNVTIKKQPTSPTQLCSVAGGTGTVVGGPVNTITVTCDTFRSVGGVVSGLKGKGLVLQNNGGDDITVNANGSFAFPTAAAKGSAYAVTVKTQPGQPDQSCTVQNGSGTIGDANVTQVAVVCATNQYAVGGSITGLAGSAVLDLNGANPLTLAAGATSFTFPAKLDSGASYTVRVRTQPSAPIQVCTLSNATGVIGSADVTNVSLSCVTSGYTVGGRVTGLQGTGLVLQNNGGDDLAISAAGNSSFTFKTAVTTGGAYAISVKSLPNVAGQTCRVVFGTGTVASANVTSVLVACGKPRRAFVTSATYNGNLGGLAGADGKCQTLADAAKLGGSYKAWLSDEDNAPVTRFARSYQPYVMVDGTVIANDWDDLVSDSVRHAIDRTEKNTVVPFSTSTYPDYKVVWTGTDSNGFWWDDALTCNNWTTAAETSKAAYGDANASTYKWSIFATGGSCAFTFPLYCFEQ